MTDSLEISLISWKLVSSLVSLRSRGAAIYNLAELITAFFRQDSVRWPSDRLGAVALRHCALHHL